MIIYLFNNYFFDDSGFSKRCRKEIDILSAIDDITIICRKDKNIDKVYQEKYKKIEMDFFDPDIPLLETPDNYTSIFYEVYRTIILYKSLSKILYEKIKQNRKKKLSLYVVNSPITLPLFCIVFVKLFGIKNTVLEFHDLEPEMAMHIKKLSRNHFIVAIEYFFEKLVCRFYNKIIVTNKTQKNILSERTGIAKKKIFILPNTIHSIGDFPEATENISLKNIKNTDFVIGYISTLSFDYTVLGICLLLKEFSPMFSLYPDIKFIIIGDGEGLQKIKKIITDYHIKDHVLLLGKVKNISYMLKKIALCIIPWERDVFTQTILPTKLFEYLSAKKPVIVPDYGEFVEIIQNNRNGMRYTTYADLTEKILQLKNNSIKRKKLAENGYKTFSNNFDLIQYENDYRQFISL